MNIQEFTATYKDNKDADKIEIKCDHPECVDPMRTIGKQPAKRNILKNDGEKFVCRDCMMKYNNPMSHVVVPRQTDEIVSVKCPDCNESRDMKMSAYFGPLDKSYSQICKSCAQIGKTVSEDQKRQISEKLTGIKRSDQFKENLRQHMKNHPEQYQAMLEVSSSRFQGKHHTLEAIESIRKGNTGKHRSIEQCDNISKGRKKMLAEQGGLLPETKAKISLATIKQYQNGFEPKLFHRRGTHTTPSGREVTYRSSYEKRAFMILDADVTVDSYVYEPFPIVYRKSDSDYDSNYLIDLLVTYKSGLRRLVEIKPKRRLDEPLVKVKVAAAQKMADAIHYDFQTWTEDELFGGCEKTLRQFVQDLDAGHYTTR